MTNRMMIASAGTAIAAAILAIGFMMPATAEDPTPPTDQVSQVTDLPTVAPRDDYTVTPAPTQAPAPIQEDDPAWNCTTMGNHICGPSAAPDSIAPNTIWPCSIWDGTHDDQVIPTNVRTDVCYTPEGNFSYPF